MTKLTKRSVEALKIEAKDYFVWDSQIAGFGLRVMPSGAKTYQAQYRKGIRFRGNWEQAAHSKPGDRNPNYAGVCQRLRRHH